MTNSEAMAILNIFDHWNERKPNYYGIPEVKYIYHNEWSDPELYYKGEYYNIYDVEDVMYSDFKEYKIENPDYSGEFENYMQEHTENIINLLEEYRAEKCRA